MTFTRNDSTSLPTMAPGDGPVSLLVWNLTSTPGVPANESLVGQSELSVAFTNFVQGICVAVLVTGVLGNSMVLLAFGLKWSKLKTCEIFMISLAFADLIGSVVIPTQHIVELTGGSFQAIGHIGCQMLSWTSITVMTVSALTLFSISIDRFVVVKWPMRERTEPWKILFVILVTWCVSSTLGIPYFIDKRVKLERKASLPTYVCRTYWKTLVEDRIHTIVVFCIQVIIPLAYMTMLYSLIVYELLLNAKSDLFEAHSRVWKLRMKRNRKATKLMITVVIVFYILILPVNIFYLCYTFGKVYIRNMHALVYTYYLLQVWSMLNAAVNPIIYSKLHTSFRRTTLRLICACFFSRFKNYDWQSMRDSLRVPVFRRKTSSKTSITSRLTRESLTTPTPFTHELGHRMSLRSAYLEEINHNIPLTDNEATALNIARGISMDGEDWSPATISVQTSLDEGDATHTKELPVSSLMRCDDEPLLEESSLGQCAVNLSPRLCSTTVSPSSILRRSKRRYPLARSARTSRIIHAPFSKQARQTESMIEAGDILLYTVNGRYSEVRAVPESGTVAIRYSIEVNCDKNYTNADIRL